jgi:voltage-gated potassium channel
MKWHHSADDNIYIRGYRKSLLLASSILTLSIIFGTVGFYWLSDRQWPLLDCFYMTVSSMTTVGYGEVIPLEEVAGGRLFAIVLSITGMGSVLYFVPIFTALLVDGRLSSLYRWKKMIKEIEKLEGHYVVCGSGKTGAHVVEELVLSGYSVVVLEKDEALCEALRKLIHRGVYVLNGDGTHDEDLIIAGTEKAAGLVAAMDSDVNNLYCTMSARQLNTSLRIIAISDDPKAEEKMRRAGADSVVYNFVISGQRIASELVNPQVVSFFDLVLKDKDRVMRIEDIEVSEGSLIAGNTLSKAELRQFGDVLVIAVRQNDETYQYNPGPETYIEAGSHLIVLGEVDCIGRVRRKVCSTS